jgi:hypothetical protein
MPTATQRAFASGEIAPALAGRADQSKYQTGLKTCVNFMVQRFGGVTNRPGTKYLGEVKDSSKKTRLLKFVFSDSQTYILEFGNLYIRFWQADAQVNVSSVAAYNGATAYLPGDLVVSSSVNYYCIAATTGNAPPNATYWYALTGSIFEVPTPYVEADLFNLQIVQSADVITICHRNYEARNLMRLGATQWRLETILWEPASQAPTGIGATVGAAGTNTYKYAVTAVGANGVESIPGVNSTAATNITNIVKSSYTIKASKQIRIYGGRGGFRIVTYNVTVYRPLVTSNAHGLNDGDKCVITGVVGMSELNNRTWAVKRIDANNFYVISSDVANWGAYASGGTVQLKDKSLALSAVPTTGAPNVISWTAVDGAVSYNIYRDIYGGYGFIGTSYTTSFNDVGITPDTSLAPMNESSIFVGVNNYPQAVGYFQQRQAFGGTNNSPEFCCLSAVSDFQNVSARSTPQDSDSVQFTMVGKTVGEVRHFVDIGQLVILTSTGEWIAKGGADGAITPTSINLKQYGHNGSSVVSPLVVNDSLLYIQARGSVVRDFRYQLESDGYVGRDLTVFSAHMFDGYSLAEWDYQQNPHSIIWSVRNDGTLLGLTYMREQEIWGWHRHTTDGLFESVAVIPDGTNDSTYFIVKRTINGVTKRYIEKMMPRNFSNIATDAFFVDCGLTYNGTNTGSTTMTVTGGTAWDVTESLTLTASSAFFSAGDVGNYYQLTVGSTIVNFVVIGYTSTTVVTVRPQINVPVALRGVATTSWIKKALTVTGLSHLEGKTVSILGDGNVNAQAVVTSGSVTFTVPYGVAHVGLPYTSDFETLSLENTQGESILDKRKNIDKVTLLVESSRGVFAGPDSAHLTEYKQRATEAWNVATQTYTGPIEIRTQSTWEGNGRVFVRQSDPLPLSVLSIAPHVSIGA